MAKWWLKNPFRRTPKEEKIIIKSNEEWVDDLREDVKAILDAWSSGEYEQKK